MTLKGLNANKCVEFGKIILKPVKNIIKIPFKGFMTGVKTAMFAPGAIHAIERGLGPNSNSAVDKLYSKEYGGPYGNVNKDDYLLY